MARERITESNLNGALKSAASAMSRTLPGREVKMDLHVGNSEYKITNKLIVTMPCLDPDGTPTGSTYTRQVWADGMAGHSKREAYNALRLMAATLALVDED